MLLSMDEFRAFEPKKTTYALFGWPLGHTMSPEPVSYTHLDVYKRQAVRRPRERQSRCARPQSQQ